VVQLAEIGAESLTESVLRMVLIQRGCPRPRVQHWTCDRQGQNIGRVDIWYEQANLAVQYDGDWHRHNLVYDNRRQNLLLEQGVQLLRFTASDVFQRPDVVAAQVRAHLQ
jgi:very-short-patch-repair endonuclease